MGIWYIKEGTVIHGEFLNDVNGHWCCNVRLENEGLKEENTTVKQELELKSHLHDMMEKDNREAVR